MICDMGIDIVKISRIERIMERQGERFLNTIFTPHERNYIKSRKLNNATISGMFASKEAVSKMLGTGIGKIAWIEIEVLHDSFRKPYVILHGNAKVIGKDKNISSIVLTISHEREYAIALAIGEGNKNNIPDLCDGKYLPKRDKNSHKGSFGRVGIIGGSMGMTGAPYLSSMAALKTGSGLVYAITPDDLKYILSTKLTEAIVFPVEDHGKGHFVLNSLENILEKIHDSNLDVVAIGPGLGVDDERRDLVVELLRSIDKPVVLDADGLNCISNEPNILKKRAEKTIITPHPGELSRLLNISIGDIQRDRINNAKNTSLKYNVITVLKGSETVVSNEDGEVYINKTGNPGMATAGSGDVLTGVILSLMGQGIEAMDSAVLGVYAHGLAGDLASYNIGEYGLMARDILNYIPHAIDLIVSKK